MNLFINAQKVNYGQQNYDLNLSSSSEMDEKSLEELKNIDVGNLTPVDALNTIYRLQNKLKNRW
mgnify:CR=1 FL=1